MGQKLFDGSMMPEYGDGAPVTPAEKGNIDIAAFNQVNIGGIVDQGDNLARAEAFGQH